MTYNVLLIGLGRIGYFYDRSNPKNYTHYSAILQNDNFEIIYAVESDEKKRKIFTQETGIASYSINNFLKKNKKLIDIIIIATPTETHLEIIKKIQIIKAKIILCEKPLSNSLNEAQEISKICKKNKTLLITNFFRRFENSALKIKNKIDRNLDFRAIVFYSNGIYNNGSHFLDLIDLWFGQPEEIEVLKKRKSFKYNDFDIDFILKYKKGDITFLSWDEKYYSNYLIKIFTEKNRIDYDFNGFRSSIHEIIENKQFKGHKIVSDKIIELNNNLYQGFKPVYEYLHYLLTNKKFNSNLDQLITPKLIEKIISKNER